jgi:hypothetical protein
MGLLMRGPNKTQKWTLVAWDKVCLTRQASGLGIKDPLVMNRATTKLWWHRMKDPMDLWSQI